MSTSSYEDGTITPRPGVSHNVAQPDTMRELLVSMANTLGSLGKTFETLNEHSVKLSTMSPTMVFSNFPRWPSSVVTPKFCHQQDTSRDIQFLRRQIRQHDKTQEATIQEVKKRVREDLKQQIVNHMKEQIQEQVKAEVLKQVTQQVEVQINDHLPVTLQQQLTESKKQLSEVRDSLINSRARQSNANLRATSLDEPLEVVLKADGKKSKLFPADLRSLFNYELKMAKELVKDYGLSKDEVLEVNFNRVMAHIGIQFQLVIIPPADGNEDKETNATA